MMDADMPRLLLSSAELGWDGIVVEQWQFPPLEPPERLLEMHEVVLSLAGPSTLEWHADRRWHRAAIPSGACCFTPAGACLQKRWPTATEDLIVRLTPRLVAHAAEDRLDSRSLELIEQHGVEDPQLRHIGLALQAEIAAGSPSGRLYVDSLATALAARLLAGYSAFPLAQGETTGGLSPSELRRAREYIQDNLSSDTSLDSLAKYVGTSPTRLKALFKQSTGWSPHQYVLRQRVERARQLLRRSDLALGQIAVCVGFYDQSHLNRHFKRIVGVTPKEFQRRL